jgi:uncharacterized peroxidase-related enzyme
MPRIKAIEHANATGQAKELFDAVKANLGIVPAMTRTMVHSPAVLESYLSFSGALGRGALNAKLREQIAITVAPVNGCQYCLSAHTVIGKMAGVSEHNLAASRQARSSDAKTEAALKFALSVVEQRGRIADADFDAVRRAGYTDGEIAEIIAHVALNIFTNYFNNITQVEVDFPPVSLEAAA